MVQASVSEASLAGDFARPHFISSETTQSVLAWPEVIQILLLFLLTFAVILGLLLYVFSRMRIFEAVKLGETV